MKSIWLDTRWGCGLVTVNDLRVIVDPVAPIFKMLRTQLFGDVVKRGRYSWEEIKWSFYAS